MAIERLIPAELMIKKFILSDFDEIEEVHSGNLASVKIMTNRDAKVLYYIAEPLIIRLRDTIITQPKTKNPVPNGYINRKNILINSTISYCKQANIPFRSMEDEAKFRRVYSHVQFGKIRNSEDLIIELI
jgi:hypothetical protein